jgi:hypothetical protein
VWSDFNSFTGWKNGEMIPASACFSSLSCGISRFHYSDGFENERPRNNGCQLTIMSAEGHCFLPAFASFCNCGRCTCDMNVNEMWHECTHQRPFEMMLVLDTCSSQCWLVYSVLPFCVFSHKSVCVYTSLLMWNVHCSQCWAWNCNFTT